MMCSLQGLAKRKDFSKVYNSGESIADRLLVLYWMKNPQPFTRIGFSVSKKLGHAVVRNRFKRILREVCRRNSAVISEGYDCIIIARPRITEENYWVIEKSFLKLIKKARIFKEVMTKNEGTDNIFD